MCESMVAPDQSCDWSALIRDMQNDPGTEDGRGSNNVARLPQSFCTGVIEHTCGNSQHSPLGLVRDSALKSVAATIDDERTCKPAETVLDDIYESSIGLVARMVGTIENYQLLPSSILDNWFYVCRLAKPCHSTHNRKIALRIHELNVRAREIYTEIMNACPDDESLLAIHHLITSGNVLTQGKRISGRTIDTLVTRYPVLSNASYYLDISDPARPVIVDEPASAIVSREHVIAFNIGSAYRQKMHQYSKTYFDCFGRGVEVEHVLSSGESICVSLCQFTFFIWATRFGVFQFLDAQYADIVRMRKQAQKEAYIRKRNPGIQSTPTAVSVPPPQDTILLCPPVIHDYRRYHDASRVVYWLKNDKFTKSVGQRRFTPYRIRTLHSYAKQ